MTPANPLVLAIAAVSFLTGPFALQAKAGHWLLVEHRSTERRIREEALHSYILGFQTGSWVSLNGYALSGGVLFSSSTVPPTEFGQEQKERYIWVQDHPEDPTEGSIGVGGALKVWGEISLRGTGDARVRANLQFHCRMEGGSANSNPGDNQLHKELVVDEDPVPPAVAQWWSVLLGTLQWFPIDRQSLIDPKVMRGKEFFVHQTTKVDGMVGTSGGVASADFKVEGRIRDEQTFQGGLQYSDDLYGD